METHEKNRIKNCIWYMMKKSASFVDRENKCENVLGDDAILFFCANSWLCFCKHFLGFTSLNKTCLMILISVNDFVQCES